MSRLVPDGAAVIVEPCIPQALAPGDIVLVRVGRTVYLHKSVWAEPTGER
jgi:hypothetical protein